MDPFKFKGITEAQNGSIEVSALSYITSQNQYVILKNMCGMINGNLNEASEMPDGVKQALSYIIAQSRYALSRDI